MGAVWSPCGTGTALVQEIPNQRHLVAGLVESGSVGTVSGEPETYKSALAHQITAHVASGEGCFLGRFPVERSGPVAYVWADDSKENELTRIQAWAARTGQPVDLPVAWYLNSGYVLPDDIGSLRDEIERHGFVLMALDSLYNFLRDPEVLRTEAIVPVLNGLKRIADETGCTILIVDHAPKPSESTRGRRPNLNPCGSVFKPAAFRWGLYTTVVNGTIRLSASSNNGPPVLSQAEIFFDRETHSVRLRHGAQDRPDLHEKVLRWVLANPRHSTKDVEDGVGGNRQRTRQALHDLENTGRVTKLSPQEIGRSGRGGRAGHWGERLDHGGGPDHQLDA